MTNFVQTYSAPDPEDASFEPDPIEPLNVPASVAEWESARADLLAAWQQVLGRPSFDDFDRTPEQVDTFQQPDYAAVVYRQPTTPRNRQTVIVLHPERPIADPCPGMVVPFYNPDRMMGLDIRTREVLPDQPGVIQFARHLAAQGYVVACSEAYPYNTLDPLPPRGGMSEWHAAARQLREEHPDWSGCGRLAWDASRALDLLLDQGGIDADRCGVIGHSLGGKIAFYAAALDARFAACVASDFGIGFSFTNWDDDWYLGDRIHQPGFERAHHEALALIAPRPFFLVGGSADRSARHYIQEAQRVYALYGRESAAGFFHHRAGHRPTDEAMRIAYAWLAEQFALAVSSDEVAL